MLQPRERAATSSPTSSTAAQQQRQTRNSDLSVWAAANSCFASGQRASSANSVVAADPNSRANLAVIVVVLNDYRWALYCANIRIYRRHYRDCIVDSTSQFGISFVDRSGDAYLRSSCCCRFSWRTRAAVTFADRNHFGRSKTSTVSPVCPCKQDSAVEHSRLLYHPTTPAGARECVFLA